MPTWMWLNLCLGTLFVLAVPGIPLWLVIARPDARPQRAPASRRRAPRTHASRRATAYRPGPASAGAEEPARLSRAGVS